MNITNEKIRQLEEQVKVQNSYIRILEQQLVEERQQREKKRELTHEELVARTW